MKTIVILLVVSLFLFAAAKTIEVIHYSKESHKTEKVTKVKKSKTKKI